VAEERERAAAETTATTARAATLAMAELAAAGAEVEGGRCSACGGSKA
jgi:mono/diheme cytochrome c family protein